MIQPEEIANATNRVNDLLSQENTIFNQLERNRVIAQALNISCDLLSKLANDEIFLTYNALGGYSAHRGENLEIERRIRSDRVQLLSRNFGIFEAFLNEETRLLRQAGYDEKAITRLDEAIRSQIEHIRQNPATGIELKGAVSRLQKHICAYKKKMIDRLLENEKRKNLILCVGGIGIISVNIAAYLSHQMDSNFSAVSADIGGGLVVTSVIDLFSGFTRRNPWQN